MRISIEKTKKGFIAIAYESEREGRTSAHTRIASGAGVTPKEAATWLVRHLHELAAQGEHLVIELGLLSSDEVAAAHHQATQEAQAS